MSKGAPDLQVMISYQQLQELLDVVAEVPKIRREFQHLEKQLLALRVVQQECIERIGELAKLL